MMLTVSMTVSHLCQNLEIVKGVNYCDKVISTPKPGEGASTERLGAFVAIINTFRSLFKASDTFDDFQVLTKMADSHLNCQHH